jgi:trimethylamine--corrinoid protein Co-methyltransferase
MGTGNISMGGPEFSLLRIATTEMAKHYKIPSRGGGLFSDSKVADAQLGVEKMMNCLTSSLAGLGVVAGMGMAGLSNTICPNVLLIDNEIIRVVRHMIRGIPINAETISKEIIMEVGFGGNYLVHEHTAMNFRKELWFPKIWDRKVWSTWAEEGAHEISVRTHQMINNYQHEQPALDDEIKQAIWEIVSAADQRIGISNTRIPKKDERK